jgi:urease accessory protein
LSVRRLYLFIGEIGIQSTFSSIQGVKGNLNLGFSFDEKMQSTRLHVYAQQPPLRVIRAFPVSDGGVLVHLHNVSGGVLGGDQLEVSVRVETKAYVQLTSTSATRIYRCQSQLPAATQTTEMVVEEGGLLEYLPDPLIPFAGSRYRQRSRIQLAAHAGLFWWETLAPGRTARDEIFAYDLLHVDLDICAEGRPLAIERTRFNPGCQFSSPARLGVYRYMSSFYICKVDLEPACWLHLEKELSIIAQQLTKHGEICWGVSTLVAHGLVVRALSRGGRDITSGLCLFWQTAKRELYGQEGILPRKLY